MNAVGTLAGNASSTPVSRRRLLELTAGTAGYFALGISSFPAKAEPAGATGANVNLVVNSRVAMSNFAAAHPGMAVYLDEDGRSGLWVCKQGPSPADPLQGIYLPSAVRGVHFERVRDSDIGRPEWFGAIPRNRAQDCRAAILACVSLVQTTLLDGTDYYITDALKLPYSNKQILGAAGTGGEEGAGVGNATGLGTTGGTRVILTGPKAVDATVLVIGKDSGARDDVSISRNLVVKNIKAARDCSVYKPRPSLTADPIDCVKGVIVSFITTSLIENVKSFDSPVGFHCFGVVNTVLRNCNVQRRTRASSATHDFFVGYLAGGYGGPNFGYIGANASIYFDHCTVFDEDPAFDRSVGMRLFGYAADTFVTQFEMARMDVGIEIDGRDARGTVISNAAGSGAQQDITLTDCVLDGCNDTGLLIHNTNDSLSVEGTNLYATGANYGIRMTDCAGSTNIASGKIVYAGLAGISVRNVNGLGLGPIHVRNCPVGVRLENVGMAAVRPRIFGFGQRMSSAVQCLNAFRCILEPQVWGAPGDIGVGINLDSASDHNRVDATMIDPAALAGGAASRKVWFNGQDALSGGSGNAAFSAAGNSLTGVMG